MDGRRLLYCSMCNFQCYTHDGIFKHIRVHENDPRFQVQCTVCGTTAYKWCTLRKHIQRSHKDIGIIIIHVSMYIV